MERLVSYDYLSDFQESLLPVEEVEEEPADGNHSEFGKDCSPFRRELFCKTSEEEIADASKVYDPLSHIDGDGIHAYDGKELGPFLPLHYVYDIKEQGEHSYAVCSYHKDE